MPEMNCIICGGSKWVALPDPHHEYSMRTDGTAEKLVLSKIQCEGCALVRRRNGVKDVEQLYYDEYELYGNLHGNEEFDAERRRSLARSIADQVDTVPDRVLEVGCGNGSTIVALQEIWPEAEIMGLEPAQNAVEMAQAHGLHVTRTMVDGRSPPCSGKFDVIYSVHVIEHTVDPLTFINAMLPCLSDDGTLVVRCPDAERPHVEIVFSDHLWSFTKHHLTELMRKCGLEVARAHICPASEAKEQSLIVAARRESDTRLSVAGPDWQKRNELLQARRSYLEGWSRVEEALLLRIPTSATEIMCFGAAQWAALIACYAPAVWRRVGACVVDGGRGQQFFGKPVLDYHGAVKQGPDLVLLGINPGTQDAVKTRLENNGLRVLTWNDLVAL